jgi:NAD(P)-dependent dehydrogenase (short-subunit alcohol dehydrogenase family)
VGTDDTSRGRLAGRVAIVTGASRGLGEAIATAFVTEGAKVAIAARTEQVWDERLPGTIYEVAERLTALGAGTGGQAIAVRCDVTQDEDLVHLVEATREAYGPIDLLVNNAALTTPGRPGQPARPSSSSDADKPKEPKRLTFVEMPLKAYRLHYEITVFAMYRLMQLVAPDMMALGRGAIVNISSAAAYVPGEGPYRSTSAGMFHGYGGSKWAMHHLSQAAAYDLAPHGVAVNVLMPAKPIPSPGMLVLDPTVTDWESAEDFAEATVLLANETPAGRTGLVHWSQEVLHPELAGHDWMRAVRKQTGSAQVG